MGLINSILQNNSVGLNRDNWQQQQQQDWQWNREGDYKRLKNNMTGEQLDQYAVNFRSQEYYNSYIEFFNFRNQQDHLVSVKNMNQEKVKQLCCSSINLTIYIEHMYLRLSDIKDIQFPENVYVLKRSLEGLNTLYSKVGHFQITENLFCINQQGIVKVWLNPNLSLIQPQQTNDKHGFYPFKHKFDSEKEDQMIWKTISMVECATSNQTIPNGFSFFQFLQRQNQVTLNFKEVLHYLNQYIAQTMIKVPDCFQTAIKVIREKKGIFDSEVDITINKRKSIDLQAAIMGGKFKESQVQRVPGFQNHTMRSYISESNNTFAEKLKHFDFGKGNSNSINFQSYFSAFKESPGKELAKQSSIFNLHLPRSSKIISNQVSQISTPSGAQSQIIINPLHNRSGKTNFQDSQMISNQKSFNTINNPSQHKYFQHYLNKQTNGSYGQNNKEKQVHMRGPFMTSQVGPKFSQMQKPTINFTYSGYHHPLIQDSKNHIQQIQAHVSPRQSRISYQQLQNEGQNLNFLPMSPPTIDTKQKVFYEHNNHALQLSKNSNKGQNYNNRIDSFKAQTSQTIVEKNRRFQNLRENQRQNNIKGSRNNQKSFNQNQVLGSQNKFNLSHHTVLQSSGEQSRSDIPQISLEEMKYFLEDNKLNFDPEIMDDLIRYEQKRRKV